MKKPSPAASTRTQRWATAGGFVAILLWSTTIALSRSLSLQLGVVGAALVVYGVSAVICLPAWFSSPSRRRKMFRLPPRYLFGCGLLFVGYALFLFLAVGCARGDQQVLEVGLINYLWPALTLVFLVTLLGKKPRALLFPGTVLALAGVVLVLTQGRGLAWGAFARNLGSNPTAYVFALVAAILWALYSALTRKWAGDQSAGAIHLFLPATAVVMVLAYPFAAEPRSWTWGAAGEAVFLGCATYVAYGLWDRAMRQGDTVLVSAGSYLTPLLSTIVTSLYLAIRPAPALWLGCGLLILGSFLSWRSIED